MKCPFCLNSENDVIDTRETDNEIVTRRRRECIKCKKRFTTYERVEVDLRVIKKDGRRESYDREKVKQGIVRACEKRPVSMDKVEEMVNRVEANLRSGNSAEVESRKIGELVMRELKKSDKVAYIRFASVYKEFTDLQSFQDEVKALLNKK